LAEADAASEKPQLQLEGAFVETSPDAYEAEAQRSGALDPAEQAVEMAQRRGIIRRSLVSWAGLFWSALGGLVSLSISLWLVRLVDDLFARSTMLGWIGLALLLLAGLAIIVMAAREIAGVMRQRKIATLHIGLAEARAADDRKAAWALIEDLASLYAKRPATARARAEIIGLKGEIIDGRDLIDIAEHGLMHPLDADVRREIAAAAKRVSILTAIAPRAVLDILVVAAQAIRLVRRIAEIYGGRPGFLGFIKLARAVATHLAVTGGMAVGDSLIQQVLGHGIAARISARLGEGVLNGLLTTRIGLSAMSVCRPMPFAAEPAPGVRDVAPFLFAGEKKVEPS
jgi:putative membrane protein